jgi:flagellar biosynthesis GTPase FlhF
MTMLSTHNRASASQPTVVEAPTLKEALRLVRARHGADARVIRSRTVTRRQSGGLGQQKLVEVLIETDALGRVTTGSAPAVVVPPARRLELTSAIAAEVERIEELVRQIAARQAASGAGQRWHRNPVAEALITAGADPGVVGRLCERFQAETGAAPGDEQAMLVYLARNLPVGSGDWQDLAGMHVFLGPSGCGRTEMILKVAGQLVARGAQVLVLSLLPRHAGEVGRLQAAAARIGCDAAVIEKSRQLGAAAAHLHDYQVVLLDAPAFGSGDGADDGLRRSLIQDPAYHRHLVYPLDRDPRDSSAIITAARTWNCDWLALSRVDQTVLPGKLLDLLDRLPLPVSLIGDADWPDGNPQLASRTRLAELVCGDARRQAASEA